MYSGNTAYTWRPLFRRISWTYAEILKHAQAFADVLSKHGVQKGDRIILCASNSPYWIAAFFGIQLKGAVAVPLSPESSAEFIREIMRQTNAKIIFKNKLGASEKTRVPTIFLEDVQKPLSPQSLSVNSESQSEEDIAEIVYTSGTTGNPKGVVLTHKNLLSNLKGSRSAIPVDHTMRSVSILPLFHMFEQIGGMLVPLSAGAQVSYPGSINPNHLKWIFQDDHINRMLAVPEFLRLVALRIKERAKDQGSFSMLERMLSISPFLPMAVRRRLFGRIHKTIGWKVHTIVSGGAPLQKDVAAFFESLGIYILQGYGLTETSPVLTVNRYHERTLDAVGKPLQDVSLKLATDGEILAKGPNVFLGYWQSEEKSKEVFDEKGWFKTGDIGFFDKNGHLHIKGRKKFVIVLPTGENIYAEDLETELNKEEGVLDSTVIGFKSAGGEKPHAVFLLDPEKKANSKDIVERANQRLLSYQRIQSFSVWPEPDFPRTPTRKVKKHEVEVWVLKDLTGKHPVVSVPTLSKLERIVAQVLEIPTQEVKDEKRLVADFNLDSLQRIELIARIENELSVALDESEITPKTTIMDLKTRILAKQQKHIRYPFNPIPFTPFIVFLRRIMQPIVFKLALLLFAPAKIHGMEHVKEVLHPSLFFSNHLSNTDAAIIYGVLPQRIRARLAAAAAADVVYESKAPLIKHSRKFLEFLFPIFPFQRRDGQAKSSFVYIGRVLDRDFSVLLFPEGQTSPTGQLQPFKQGAGLLALNMEVPVVPIKLQDTQKIIPTGQGHPVIQWPKRNRVKVTFGKPVMIPRKMSYQEATRFLQQKVQEL